MGKIGDLWVKLKLKSDEYKKGLDDAQGKTRSFADKIKGLSAAAVAVWGAIGAAATKMALDFVKSSQTIGDQWDILMTQFSTRWQQMRAELNRGIAQGIILRHDGRRRDGCRQGSITSQGRNDGDRVCLQAEHGSNRSETSRAVPQDDELCAFRV